MGNTLAGWKADAIASAAIPESEAPTNSRLDVDTEPLTSKRAAASSIEDISPMESGNSDDLNGICKNPQKKMKESSKNTETELQGDEINMPPQDETDDEDFILMQSKKKHPKKRNAEDGPLENGKLPAIDGP